MLGTHIPLEELSEVALALIDAPHPPSGRDDEKQVHNPQNIDLRLFFESSTFPSASLDLEIDYEYAGLVSRP